MARFDAVQVWVDLDHFAQPVLMGTLHCRSGGAGEIFSFEYERSWLERPEVFAPAEGSTNPGGF